MRIQALFLILFVGFCASPSHAHIESKCFDFQKTKVVSPLKDPKDPALDWAKLETSSQSYGKTPEDLGWAAVKGTVKEPINTLLEKLYNLTTVKGFSFSKLDAQERQDKNYLKFYHVYLENKPVLFFTLEWEEEWAFALAAGTKESPKKVVISYQKVAGTSHLERLCGNIVLSSVKENETEVYLYEDIKAPRRTVDDTLKGLVGTLETLRN